MHPMRELITLLERTCQTPGANYEITLSDDEIGGTVHLPDAVTVPDLSDKQAKKYENMLHDALEEIVVKIIDDLDADSTEHWAEARANDRETRDD